MLRHSTTPNIMSWNTYAIAGRLSLSNLEHPGAGPSGWLYAHEKILGMDVVELPFSTFGHLANKRHGR